MPHGISVSVITMAMTEKDADQIETASLNKDVDLNETLPRVAVVPGGCSRLTCDLG